MVATIKQTVTVQHDGRIEIHSPELRAGSQAEVTVFLQPAPQPQPSNVAQLDALMALQRGLHLDQSAADHWIQQVRAERAASGPQG